MLGQAMSTAAEPELTARRILETIPTLAGVLRDLTRLHVPGELSIREWRWLYFLASHPGADLPSLTESYGRDPEEVEPVIDRLVEIGVVARVDDGPGPPALAITDQGGRALAQARETVADRLADRVADVGPGTLATVTEALDILEEVLVKDGPRDGDR